MDTTLRPVARNPRLVSSPLSWFTSILSGFNCSPFSFPSPFSPSTSIFSGTLGVSTVVSSFFSCCSLTCCCCSASIFACVSRTKKTEKKFNCHKNDMPANFSFPRRALNVSAVEARKAWHTKQNGGRRTHRGHNDTLPGVGTISLFITCK